MYKSAQDRKKTAEKRTIKMAIAAHLRLPNGAHATRQCYVAGEASHRKCLRNSIKGGDRRTIHMQLHDAKRGNVDVNVIGKDLPNLVAATSHLTS